MKILLHVKFRPDRKAFTKKGIYASIHQPAEFRYNPTVRWSMNTSVLHFYLHNLWMKLHICSPLEGQNCMPTEYTAAIWRYWYARGLSAEIIFFFQKGPINHRRRYISGFKWSNFFGTPILESPRGETR